MKGDGKFFSILPILLVLALLASGALTARKPQPVSTPALVTAAEGLRSSSEGSIATLSPLPPSEQGEGARRQNESTASVDEAVRAHAQNLLDSLPLDFIPNQGQVDEQVDFYVKGRDKLIYFTPQGLTFVLTTILETNSTVGIDNILNPSSPPTAPHPQSATRWVVKLDFVDANPDVHPVGEEKTDTTVSYFKGSPDQWHTGIPTYRRIVYKDLWPGIDLAFTGTVNELKYEFIVRPGADPDRIRLTYRGAEVVQAADGSLEITTPVGGFTDVSPTAYQEIEGRRVPVSVAYDLAPPVADPQPATRHVRFAVGPYDPTRPLVLDPAILIYCGYIGGTGGDYGLGIAVDEAGNAYVVGQTYSSESRGFPVSAGPDPTFNDDDDPDAFVAKVRADGTGLDYCGYIGGANEDSGWDIAVDGAGNAYIVGTTYSSPSEGFPVTVGPDLTFNGSKDAFVAKVRADGTRLDYCGYIGGTDEDSGWGIAVDGAGNAYIVGRTYSSESEGFPVAVGPDLTFNGDDNSDAFVAKVQADGARLDYCGYIGGIDNDLGWDIAVDEIGNAYIVGTTYSSFGEGFPVAVGPDLTFNDDDDEPDAFVAKVRADGTGLDYCGYIGGTDEDSGWGIAVDGAGNAYVVGTTYSSPGEGFPVAVGPDLTFNGLKDAFVARVRADGRWLDYCGYIGGLDWDEGLGIAVDRVGNAYVAGTTHSSPSENFPVIVGPDLTFNGGYKDAFVAKVQAGGVRLDYCGYIGGSASDYGYGIAVDGTGNTYVVGTTDSSPIEGFPVTIGPSLTFNGYRDAFVARIWAESGSGPFILPVYPGTHTISNTVMQGGTTYRYFRLLDSTHNPISNATITLSTGSTATTDAQGYFTATIAADSLGGVGSYMVSIQSVTYGGQTYDTAGQPAFPVQVTDRRYSYAWSYGASTKLKGGISAGLIAYLQYTTSGGMELKLDESDPNISSDDVVSMKEDFSDEVGIGGGIGIEGEVNILILKIKGGASATSEWAIRSIGSTQARFSNPYSDNDRKAAGVFLLASVIDSIGQAFPGQPLAMRLLKLSLDRGAPYRDYISRQQAGLGSKITPLQANVGASASLGIKRSGLAWEERILGFDLVDVGVTVVQMNTLTDYRDRNEWGLGYESEHEINWSLLSWQIGDLRNKLAGTIGDGAKKAKVELIFDSDTNALKRLEISFTGEGNPYAFTDVLKEEVTFKLIIPANSLGDDRLARLVNIIRLLSAAQRIDTDPLQIGPSAMAEELNTLLEGLRYAEYEITVDDGAETRFEISLSVTAGIDISLGPGLKIKKVRSLVRERGVFINGHPYRTESYNADAYVSRPGKSWQSLSTNAMGGLWLLVQDAFSWVWKQVTSGAGWVISAISRTVDGIIQGGAQIIAPPGTQLHTTNPDLRTGPIQQTEPITITAIGWAPTRLGSSTALNLGPTTVTASGEGLVIGGIYAFQPYTLTLSPGATLVITYTDEAVAGVNEHAIGMFRWNPEESNWQPLTAISDTARNVFTATITQLGTFALGYDVTPPQITILEPADGSINNNTLPLISALVVDTGGGVDPSTVEMRLDGRSVAADYITSTGQLVYLPPTPLANGLHTITVSARDVLGNVGSTLATFTVEIHYTLYLPLILQDR